MQRCVVLICAAGAAQIVYGGVEFCTAGGLQGLRGAIILGGRAPYNEREEPVSSRDIWRDPLGGLWIVRIYVRIIRDAPAGAPEEGPSLAPQGPPLGVKLVLSQGHWRADLLVK